MFTLVLNVKQFESLGFRFVIKPSYALNSELRFRGHRGVIRDHLKYMEEILVDFDDWEEHHYSYFDKFYFWLKEVHELFDAKWVRAMPAEGDNLISLAKPWAAIKSMYYTCKI
jgi:hypothetical protein